MESGPFILCIGTATVDVIARPTRAERIDISSLNKAEHLMCLTFASKTLLDQLTVEPGGSAANSANVLSLLGSRVQLLSAVGNDFFGELIYRDLQHRGIGTDFLRRVRGAKSGVGIGILSGSGEKSMLVYRGANDFLGPSSLPAEAVKNCSAVFITSLTSRTNFGLFLRAIRLARRYRKRIVFAPSITMLKRFSGRIRLMHEKFDLCIMNYEEAMYYTKKTRLAAMLKSVPGRTRVITGDKSGAYAYDGRNFYHVPAPVVRIADTTGAGDAFTGALVYEYSRCADLAKSLEAATAMAAIKLEHKGPKVDLDRKEIRKRLARHLGGIKAKRVRPEGL